MWRLNFLKLIMFGFLSLLLILRKIFDNTSEQTFKGSNLSFLQFRHFEIEFLNPDLRMFWQNDFPVEIIFGESLE